MKRLITILITLMIVGSGCSSLYESQKLRTEPIVEEDEFSKTTVIGMENEQYVDNDSYYGYYYQTLRSWIDQEGNVSHQLYVSTWYFDDGWHYFTDAKDTTRKSLEFTQISRDVNCSGYGDCKYFETFGVTIPHSKLVDAMQTGYKIKVYSKSGIDHVLKIAPIEARKQIDVVKQTARKQNLNVEFVSE